MREKSKSKVEVEERTAKKPKMTAEQKAALEACKSFNADVGRAKCISNLADCVLRDMCKTCDHLGSCAADRKKFGFLSTMNCRMAAIASVVVGMIQEGGAK